MNDKAAYLHNNGFVILDILEENEIAYLNELADKFLGKQQGEFISSSHFLDHTMSVMINDELHKIIKPKINKQFPNLLLLGGTLATKKNGSNILKAHNDWSIVDETKFNSYNLWTPLVNTDKLNGTLGLIPSSHKWNNALRGFNIPNDYEKYTNDFLKIGYEPDLKAGQAILYNHKLIHYSRPNTTAHPRNVAIVGLKDTTATLMVSFCLNNKSIDTYKVTEADFYKFDAVRIAENNTKIASQKMQPVSMKWHQIEKQFSSNLSDEFKYLTPKRKSFIAKFLDKF